MSKKRFRKVMGFIQDNTCEKGDVKGLMDLTEIEDLLNGYEMLCLMLININSELHDTIVELKEECEMLAEMKLEQDFTLKWQKERYIQSEKEKEYYREYALQYLLEYDLYTDNFLNDIKDIIGEEGVKKVKEKQSKIIEALKKEGLYEVINNE